MESRSPVIHFDRKLYQPTINLVATVETVSAFVIHSQASGNSSCSNSRRSQSECGLVSVPRKFVMQHSKQLHWLWYMEPKFGMASIFPPMQCSAASSKQSCHRLQDERQKQIGGSALNKSENLWQMTAEKCIGIDNPMVQHSRL